MFCPKCGSILMPKKENSKKILTCSCGYKSGKVEAVKIKEANSNMSKDVEVVHNSDVSVLPKTTVACPKCGHAEAYFWLLQTRGGDEPETKFLKCVKCAHTWRDYS